MSKLFEKSGITKAAALWSAIALPSLSSVGCFEGNSFIASNSKSICNSQIRRPNPILRAEDIAKAKELLKAVEIARVDLLNDEYLEQFKEAKADMRKIIDNSLIDMETRLHEIVQRPHRESYYILKSIEASLPLLAEIFSDFGPRYTKLSSQYTSSHDGL